MLGSLRFKGPSVPRAAPAGKRGHYGGGLRSASGG
jgi:hypothetical protein